MKRNTKCIVLDDNFKSRTLKPIEFNSCLSGFHICRALGKPNDWDNIELIRLGQNDEPDYMFAYNDKCRQAGVFYLGKWNDGGC